MEEQVQYGNGEMKAVTASGLIAEFDACRRRVRHATIHEHDMAVKVTEQKEFLAIVEAITIDKWLGGIEPAELKTKYDSNAEDRARNTLVHLTNNEWVVINRDLLQAAEREHVLARIELEDAREALRALHIIGWAYGGECERDSAVIRLELDTGLDLSGQRDMAGNPV